MPTQHEPRASHFSDRLLAAIERKGSPVCVGIDPVLERLPETLRQRVDGPDAALAAIAEYGSILLDAVADHVPAVKFQSACFERYRHDGVEVLHSLMKEASDLGLVVVLDAKRGDVSITAEHYAAGIFEPWVDEEDLHPALRAVPDAVTINAYLGEDSMAPFCRDGHGAFALVRTSNPGGDEIQTATLCDGGTVAERVARMVDRVGGACVGESGWSDLGAVVGATKRAEIARLRELMPRAIFLVPGYGAQGAGAEDVRACFDARGQGAIVTASRSVIYAFEKSGGKDWAGAVAAVARSFADEVAAVATGG